MRILANLGDVNPLDHGGFFVTADEISVVEPCEGNDDKRTDKWEVHRFSNKQCYLMPDGNVSDNEFHKSMKAWFDIADVDRTCGQTNTAELLCSEDPVERAMGYQNVIANDGVYNFDQYPIFLTRTEVSKMFNLYRKAKQS